jgi:hypothetical protein
MLELNYSCVFKTYISSTGSLRGITGQYVVAG